jgi:hypothetical protein
MDSCLRWSHHRPHSMCVKMVGQISPEERPGRKPFADTDPLSAKQRRGGGFEEIERRLEGVSLGRLSQALVATKA